MSYFSNTGPAIMPSSSANTTEESTTRPYSCNHTINKAIRQLVWNRYIGAKNGIGYCWCCNSTLITAFEFECGHVLARSEGGPDTVENLRPICGLCNRSMGKTHMIEFQKKHGLTKTPFTLFIESIYNMWS